jgi:hypothetical protein
VLTTPTGVLFQLPRRPIATVSPDPPVPIAGIRFHGAEPNAAEVNDAGVSVRPTPFPQMGGNEVTVTFDRPVAISRLEIDLGRFKDDYPRKLRVSSVDAGRDPVTVWEGSTTGVAMIAALTDPNRTPLVFDLAPVSRGRQMILTVLEPRPESSWSIADLKVFGQ